MDVSDVSDLIKADELVESDEGLRLKIYKDTRGNETIGYGRNLQGKGITQAEAEYLLTNDIIEARSFIHRQAWADLIGVGEAREAVLIDMYINLGQERFSGFHEMIGAIANSDWKRASAEILNSDAHTELPRRYNRLAEIMLSGEFPDHL